MPTRGACAAFCNGVSHGAPNYLNDSQDVVDLTGLCFRGVLRSKPRLNDDYRLDFPSFYLPLKCMILPLEIQL